MPKFDSLNNLQKLQDIVSNLPLMADIGCKCDKRYGEVTDTNFHDPNNFLPPYDAKKAHVVAANVLAVFAVVGEMQKQVIIKGAKTRAEIDRAIIDELDSILATPDYRALLKPEVLELMPLNVEQAIGLFKDKIGYLIAANATWNAFQWARSDKGGPLAAHVRSNIFSELSLGVLMLDWDQVLVIAKTLKELLTGDNLKKKTMELKAIHESAQGGDSAA